MATWDALGLARDLWFGERLTTAFRAQGLAGRVTADVDTLVRWIQATPPRLAVVDLTALDDDAAAGLAEALARVAHVAGFGPHGEAWRFAKARALGISTLWANAALDKELPRWLRRYGTGPAGNPEGPPP